MFFISIFVDVKIENYYVLNEYENAYENAQHSMSLSQLKSAYDEFENLKKIINEFIENHDYSINFRNFDKNKKKH